LSVFVGLEKGADDYIVKPFNARELMARIHVNLKLSHVRRRLIAEQQHQVQIKQLLFTISNKIRSGFGIQETLDTAVSEIKKVLSCDYLLIVQDTFEQESTGCKVMAASLPLTVESENIVGCIFSGLNVRDYMADNSEQQPARTAMGSFSATHPEAHTYYDGHLTPDSLSNDIKICTDCESKILQQRVSFLSAAIHLNSSPWGWIIAYRQPYNEWTKPETNFLHQVSNQISLAIGHAVLVEEKLKREAQVKAMRETNKAKSQILANTSHGKEDCLVILCLLSQY